MWVGVNTLLLITPLSLLHVGLLLALSNAFCLHYWQGLALQRPTSVTGIEWQDDAWQIHQPSGTLPVTLVSFDCFRDRYLVLNFRAGWRYWRVYLWPDSGDASALRKLRIRLLHNI